MQKRKVRHLCSNWVLSLSLILASCGLKTDKGAPPRLHGAWALSQFSDQEGQATLHTQSTSDKTSRIFHFHNGKVDIYCLEAHDVTSSSHFRWRESSKLSQNGNILTKEVAMGPDETYEIVYYSKDILILHSPAKSVRHIQWVFHRVSESDQKKLIQGKLSKSDAAKYLLP